MEEIWKTVEGYEENYEISSFGNIRSIGGGHRWGRIEKIKVLTPNITKFGYKRIHLYKNNQRKRFYVQVLVAKAFIPNPENKAMVNHKDGNKLNNFLSNLEWNTCSENNKHAFDTGLNRPRIGSENTLSIQVLQFDLKGVFLKEWGSIKLVQTELGYDRKSIANCCRNKPKYKTAYGFIWKFKEQLQK